MSLYIVKHRDNFIVKQVVVDVKKLFINNFFKICLQMFFFNLSSVWCGVCFVHFFLYTTL
jgi:hypothetical protein